MLYNPYSPSMTSVQQQSYIIHCGTTSLEGVPVQQKLPPKILQAQQPFCLLIK